MAKRPNKKPLTVQTDSEPPKISDVAQLTPRRTSPRKLSAIALVSPTGALEVQKLRLQLQNEQTKNAMLVKQIEELNEDKQFLKQQLQQCSAPRPSHATSKAMEISSSSSGGSSDESSDLSDSSDTSKEKSKKKQGSKKSKKKKIIKMKETESYSRTRLCNPKGIVARYKKALKLHALGKPMPRCFRHIGVNRNTMARTAAIAELFIAAPEVYATLPPWNEATETVASFSKRCKEAMNGEVSSKIKSFKAQGKLLPIKHTNA
uniref:Uncharacterized LOC111856887 n=1 Tax=Paramormyrops kingsleyae TaxID=1676925 RepID=A0A3B3RAK3_9TELE